MTRMRRHMGMSGCGLVSVRLDHRTPNMWDVVVRSSVVVTLGDNYSLTFWGRLPDDEIRGCNELFTYDGEG